MRLVRKVSKKRYLGKNVYESERFLVLIPSKSKELVKPSLSLDLVILMKPVNTKVQ